MNINDVKLNDGSGYFIEGRVHAPKVIFTLSKNISLESCESKAAKIEMIHNNIVQ